MTQAVFADYQADALFLLVGPDPLPNYVAARLLLKADGVLYLMHTDGPDGALPAAHALARRLAPFFARRQFVPVNAADPAYIRRQVESVLAQRNPLGVVGLSYAGGTRVMAVHAYQAIEAYCGRSSAVFSYLDSDRLELTIESRPGKPALRRRVGTDVTLTLAEALDLHDAQVQSSPQDKPCLPALARALAQMHHTLAGVVSWRKFNRPEVMAVWDGRPWEYAAGELHGALMPSDLVAQLEAAFDLDPPEPLDLRAVALRAGLDNTRALFDWLAEGWLKDWALSCVAALGYPQRTRDLACTTAAGEEIRADVAVMRGYQLFALYCSVATNAEKARLDLLEVYPRVRRIGGDEARLGLVCLVNEPERLERDIAQAWDAAGRVRVFGARDLPDLQRRLEAWFEGVTEGK